MNLDKYYYGDGDYVHVDEPRHIHVLGNHLLLSLIFLDYELGFDFVLRILICTESIKTKSRKRQVIH